MYLGEGGIPDIRNRIYRERGTATLNASGEATVSFANVYPNSGDWFLLLTPWIATGQDPVIANPTQWNMIGSDYAGFDMKGARLRALPSPLTLISQLVGFRPWSDSAASGVKVDWMLYGE